jgi:hypothetical protein
MALHAWMRCFTSRYEDGSSNLRHTSAYVSIRQHTSAYVSIRQHTDGSSNLRHTHTSVYVLLYW